MLPEPSKEDVVRRLKETEADVLLNFLPVGSQEATEFYMECALEAGVAVVNCMPVFIASDPTWEKRFEEAGVPIIGDDIKAQFGATIVHRALTNLIRQRGVKLDRTYQLNTGGNTDFLNMMNRTRLKSKKISKTEAVQSVWPSAGSTTRTSMSAPATMCLAERQQALLPAHGRPAVRRRADEHRGAPVGRGLPQFRRRRDRRDPLRQAGAGPRHGRAGLSGGAPFSASTRPSSSPTTRPTSSSKPSSGAEAPSVIP